MNSNDTTSLRSPKQDQCKYVSVDKGTVSECSWSMAKSNAVAPSTLARFRSAPAAFRNSKAWLWRFISGCFKTKKHRIQEIHQFIINLHQSWKYLKIFHRPFSDFHNLNQKNIKNFTIFPMPLFGHRWQQQELEWGPKFDRQHQTMPKLEQLWP